MIYRGFILGSDSKGLYGSMRIEQYKGWGRWETVAAGHPDCLQRDFLHAGNLKAFDACRHVKQDGRHPFYYVGMHNSLK